MTFCSSNKKYKHLLTEWDEKENSQNGIFQNDIIYCDSKINIHWKCSKCLNQWTSTLRNRITCNHGCKVCAGKEIKQGINDLATYCIDKNNIENYRKKFNKDLKNLLVEWHEEKNFIENKRTIYNTSHGYKGKIWWICANGHNFNASPNDRVQKGTGCRYCSNKDLLKGFNDLETFCNRYKIENAHLLDEWHEDNEQKPNEVLFGSNKKVKWKCLICGYEWYAAVRNRITYPQNNGKIHNGTGCDKCARLQKSINLRINKTKGKELSTLNPKLAKEWHPDCNKNYSKKYGFILTPNNTSANSHDIVWWKCSKCEHEWSAQVKARNNGSGCPECYKRKRKNENIN
jgi:hypothetical protein